mmetsp:Transcript_20373/g.49917  ORF Transcript_20373/g.49917 Transcript_20373/m.49917 type:complete len:86 (-) Transcript_20373:1103-1360(-)
MQTLHDKRSAKTRPSNSIMEPWRHLASTGPTHVSNHTCKEASSAAPRQPNCHDKTLRSRLGMPEASGDLDTSAARRRRASNVGPN